MKIAYQNTSDHPQYVAGQLVQPNETIWLSPADHPDHRVTGVDPAQPAPQHIVDVLLGGAESDLMAALPSLCDEDLDDLGSREQDGAARKAVLGEIAQIKLNRANAQHGGSSAAFDINAKAEDLIATMVDLSDADLQALHDAESLGKKRKTVLDAVLAEQAKRKTA
ncbi:MAG: hypothetical protein WAS93_03540 [Burkholderiaceae bacterium]